MEHLLGVSWSRPGSSDRQPQQTGLCPHGACCPMREESYEYIIKCSIRRGKPGAVHGHHRGFWGEALFKLQV